MEGLEKTKTLKHKELELNSGQTEKISLCKKVKKGIAKSKVKEKSEKHKKRSKTEKCVAQCDFFNFLEKLVHLVKGSVVKK